MFDDFPELVEIDFIIFSPCGCEVHIIHGPSRSHLSPKGSSSICEFVEVHTFLEDKTPVKGGGSPNPRERGNKLVGYYSLGRKSVGFRANGVVLPRRGIIYPCGTLVDLHF